MQVPHSANATCLVSFCIYCPTLSAGREDRAMDNVIFFYPEHTHPNQQMNHVGFCVGTTCLRERFGLTMADSVKATVPVQEINLSDSIITLFSPTPELWVAVETTPAFNASAVLPVVQCGFDAFVLRYGMSTVMELVSTPRCVSSLDGADNPHATARAYFGMFARFLEERVLLLDVDHDRRVTRSVKGGSPVTSPLASYSSSFSLMSVPLGNAAEVAASKKINLTRWRRRWAEAALSESLLGFPVVMRAAHPSVQAMCHSIVLHHLSFLSDHCASKGNKNGMGCREEEYHGVPINMRTTSLGKAAQERLLWTTCTYVVFIGKTLKVVVSNAPQNIISQLTCLLLMNPELTEFRFCTENGPGMCFVCHGATTLALVMVDGKLCYLMGSSILVACSKLASEIEEFLSTGGCPTAHLKGRLPSEKDQKRPGSLSAPRFQLACDSKLDDTTRNGRKSPFTASISGPVKMPGCRSTFQWTVFHNSLVVGSSLQEYPRSVQLRLSAALFEFVKRSCPPVSHPSDAFSSTHVGLSASLVLEDCSALSSSVRHLLQTVVEKWIPLSGNDWLCVMAENGRLGVIVFYSSPLPACFKVAAALRREVLFIC
ncbi:hypothetical protein TRVL_00347 [Trypanosoma vivax]|uniref:CCZ1/INTU/HSP4 first Longin domain-containing protein n=1 Tax=Trypanosoma vivax (strain Y486) TaxID=1055687 RepID=G0UCQ9_TRYVY|nr:hypothetical protein TRVL_00347 [Trypanosoma vivax]CCC53619.1 conserved hypothetical protein [Trypanosoma vivax Y486]